MLHTLTCFLFSRILRINQRSVYDEWTTVSFLCHSEILSIEFLNPVLLSFSCHLHCGACEWLEQCKKDAHQQIRVLCNLRDTDSLLKTWAGAQEREFAQYSFQLAFNTFCAGLDSTLVNIKLGSLVSNCYLVWWFTSMSSALKDFTQTTMNQVLQQSEKKFS